MRSRNFQSFGPTTRVRASSRTKKPSARPLHTLRNGIAVGARVEMNILRFMKVEAAENLLGQEFSGRTEQFPPLSLGPPWFRVICGSPTSG